MSQKKFYILWELCLLQSTSTIQGVGMLNDVGRSPGPWRGRKQRRVSTALHGGGGRCELIILRIIINYNIRTYNSTYRYNSISTYTCTPWQVNEDHGYTYFTWNTRKECFCFASGEKTCLNQVLLISLIY